MNSLKLVTPSLVDERLHVDQALIVHVEHDHVRADVDAGARAPLVPVLEPDQRALARGLIAEVDERGGAAECGRLGAGTEGIDGVTRPELPVEMRVHIDAAGHDQQPVGIVHFDVRARGDVLADGLDAPVDDQMSAV